MRLQSLDHASELNKWLGITRDEINIIYTGKTELQARVSIIRYACTALASHILKFVRPDC